MPNKLPVNEDTSWIRVGDAVRYRDKRGAPNGRRVLGEGYPDTAWLCVGAVGRVVEVKQGYPRHPCPDHHKEPDCICGGYEFSDEVGWIPAHAAWATVEFESDKPGVFIKRAIDRDGEGDCWERV